MITLDKNRRTVFAQGKHERLTPKEWALLSFLVDHEGQTFTAQELYKHIWDEEPFQCEGIIAVHLRHVREKIEKDPSNPIYIKSSWGFGYSYNPS